MNSRPPTPLSDHAERLSEFIDTLSVDRESVASEIDVLRSIYGDKAIRIWRRSDDAVSSATLRYEVDAVLPSYEDIHVQVLVSLPPSYPNTSPPQLQLLSRYIGAFSVDRQLFSDVLKTFISLKSGVDFSADTVVVFDGLQHVVEMCSTWYDGRLRAEKVGDLVREAERNRHDPNNDGPDQIQDTSQITVDERILMPVELPGSIELVEAEPITDRKSVFIGRACRITHPSQVSSILSYLMTDRRIAGKTIINAWRCRFDGALHQDHDDGGETAAGGRLAHLLQILVSLASNVIHSTEKLIGLAQELDGILVVVTRAFGGIHLGPDRFKHINQAARAALEKGHFLDVDVKTKSNPRGKRRN